MILERTEIEVHDSKAGDFARIVMSDMAPLLRQCKGMRDVQVLRGKENPSKFLLLIEWESLGAHHAAQSTPEHRKLRSMFGPFSKAAAMEHFKAL